MLKKTLKRAGIGFLLGCVVGNLIAFFCVLFSKGDGMMVSEKIIAMCGGEAGALLLQSFLSGLIGFAGCAGMSFYEIEKWGLLRIMATHLAVIFAVFLPVSYILDWFGSVGDLLIMSLIMLVWYFIIYLIMCAVYRRRVKELNVLQKEFEKRRSA